ncbi:MAG: ATP-dependent RNA helicase dbp7 [Claussenomyces sp. TS43310]|nr:MAG: ATP-dependent RNA helicase dbp7 [Claussenomyces sp. TS43310]
MADDGMLMNFEIGETPLSTKTLLKGGSWRDRLTAKKAAKRGPRVQRESRHPSTREIFQEDRHVPANEEYIGVETASPRPAKRPRLQEEKSVAGRNAVTASIISGKLPPGSISSSASKVVKFGDDDEALESRDQDVTGSRHSTRMGLDAASGASGRFTQGKATMERGRETSRAKSSTFVSSLFTFNPEATTTAEAPQEETEPAKPSNAPLSDEYSTFTTLGMSTRLAAHLTTKLEMKAPTAIQKAAISQLIKDDSDAFVQAETGSGKTLAYLLPIVERIMAISAAEETNASLGAGQANGDGKLHRYSGLFAIVLAPTRELCKQISTVLDRLLRCAPWIVGTTVMGGESKKSEKARLRKGVNILVATPGRLADHLDNTEVLNVSTVRWLVLDEGDRLMELGFEEEIKRIVQKIRRLALTAANLSVAGKKALPSRRITILCSATMKMDVQKLGEISLKDAVHIKADPSDEDAAETEARDDRLEEGGFSAPAQLKQEYAVVPAKLRLVSLTALLKHTFARRGSVMKAIIFISCADSVDFHFSLLSRPSSISNAKGEDDDKGPQPPPLPQSSRSELIKDTTAWGTAFSNPDHSNPVLVHKLHGSLAQNIRTATLRSFADAKDPCVLLCTDVASRGLDLPNVDYVIEYDPAFSADDHVHRIGRTARAGAPGRALIFLLPGDEEGYIAVLARSYHHHQTTKALTAHTADDLLSKGFGSASARGGGVGTHTKAARRAWEDRATEWQLDVERWLLEAPSRGPALALALARRAFQSHIRAYATHVAAERPFFNLRNLHLGHLAKAFALRDAPASIRVPGARQPVSSAGAKAQRRRIVAGAGAGGLVRNKGEGESKGEGDAEGEKSVKGRREKAVPRERERERDDDDAGRRMRRKMREHMSAAAEFNIG